MSQLIFSLNSQQQQDTLPEQEKEMPNFVDTIKKVNYSFKKISQPRIDTVDHEEVDTLSYFFHKLNVVKPFQDSILYKSLNDAPEFYVDSVIHADKKELTTNYDEFKHYMKVLPAKDKTLYSNSKDWISGVLFVIILVLLLVRTVKNSFLSSLTLVVFQYREFSKNVEKTNYSDANISNLLTLIYSLSISLLVFLILQFLEFNLIANLFLFFVIVVALVLVIIFSKRLLILLSGFFLKERELAFKYNKNIQLFNNTLGLLIIPFILSIPFIHELYTSTLIYSSITIIAFIYLVRLFRSVKIFIEYNVSILYMILYLCTLEILPNLLVYKILELISSKAGII